MADELTKLWGNLTLTEDEDCVEVDVQAKEFDTGATIGKTCVIGKLIVEHLVSKETIKDGLISWWKPFGDLVFKVLGENLFLIEFSDKRDKDRVLSGRPWAFESSLFLVEDFEGLAQPSDFKFDTASFWVRMVNLPLACMGAEVGRKIGATMGMVEAVDVDANGMGWGEFLRVKIRLDLKKPLLRGRKLNVQGKQVWVTFKYERLPRFCFNCGVICHGKTGCSNKSELRNQGTTRYGPWLRAASPPRKAERSFGQFTTKRGPANVDPKESYARKNRRADDRRKEEQRPAETGGDDADVARGAGVFKDRRDFCRYAAKVSGEDGGDSGDYGDSGFNSQAAKERNSGDVGDSFFNVQTVKGKVDTSTEEAIMKTINAGDFLVSHKLGEDVHYSRTSPTGVAAQFSRASPAGGTNDKYMGWGGEEKVISPNFKGPLFSDLEKQLQVSNSESGGKKDNEPNKKENGMMAWKRVACGDVEFSNDKSHTVKQGGGKKRELSGEAKQIGPARKGQKMSLVAKSTSGSGMAEAAMQSRRPQ
jgi:hypothetical protein